MDCKLTVKKTKQAVFVKRLRLVRRTWAYQVRSEEETWCCEPSFSIHLPLAVARSQNHFFCLALAGWLGLLSEKEEE